MNEPVTSSKKNTVNHPVSVGFVLAVCLLTAWILLADKYPQDHNDEPHNHASHEHEQGHDMEEIAIGPHGGRLLSRGDFELEITIYETGLPPEFRVYAYDKHGDGHTVAADEVTLNMELTRSGNRVELIQFSPQQDYLRSNETIDEPHSFEVTVNASYENSSYTWHYDNFEGRTNIPDGIASEMGISAETVAPRTLTETRTFTGRVQTNPNRLSRVRPRFAGIVRKINVELGDAVNAGDILATLESNESLQNYTVKAPIGGQVIKRDLQVGEATGDDPLFIIADYSDVWVELDVFVRDLPDIKKGQEVIVETLDNSNRLSATIDWISPLTAHASQSVQARVIVDNQSGVLRPGQFVRGHVTIAQHEAAMAIRRSALQRFHDHDVVFARVGNIYEVRMLELGRGNHDWIEVLDGIDPGTEYVTTNSYLIKADIEKSGASHSHAH